jgi:tRNA A-37 threonylcarbamoyl transferase component Bud32
MNYFYTKNDVSLAEYYVHSMLFNSHIVNIPRPYSYDKETNIMTMQRIANMSIADYYGESFTALPISIQEGIRDCIKTLYYHGIEYPDITGYNFIEWNDKIWIIDFGHASYKENRNEYDPFILEFINGYDGWNPEYA